MTDLTTALRAAHHLHQRGEHAGAAELLRVVLEQDASHVDALHLLGLCLHAEGDSAAGLEQIRKAIEIQPSVAMLHTHAGALVVALGDVKGGITSYLRAIDLDPDYPDAYNNLGVALQALGRPKEAAAVLRRAVALWPDGASPLVNLGNALLVLRQSEEAAAQYRRAIEISPDLAEAHNNLGNALRMLRSYADAVESFDRALAIRPDYAEAHCGRAYVLATWGDSEAALEAIDRAIAIRPDPRFRLAKYGMMTVIPCSRADIQEWRDRFVNGIAGLLAEGFRMPGSPIDNSVTAFYMAYHGENDRDVMTLLSRFYRQAYPTLQWTAPHCVASPPQVRNRRIRVGFYSSYLRQHAVAWTVRGLLEQLPREDFEIILFTLPHTGAEIMPEIRAAAEKVVDLRGIFEEVRAKFADERLDVLIFADIGMEPLSYALAHARLAPVQCVTWGHPVTTGISTVDYYISSDMAEPDDADEHYSERLVRLSGIQTCYRRPKFSTGPKLPRFVGLPEGATVYLCAQSPFKIHPDMDLPLADILRRDPAGVLLCFDGIGDIHKKRLWRRWKQPFSGVMHRVRFLRRTSLERFLAIVASADVLLDTWPFGGGNTSYQGFAAGVPIATFPGKYLRGRGTLALYRHMGFTDCVADTPERYVDIAVRLGTDPEFHDRMSALIRERCHILFDDECVGRDLARFLREVTGQAKSGSESLRPRDRAAR